MLSLVQDIILDVEIKGSTGMMGCLWRIVSIGSLTPILLTSHPLDTTPLSV